MITCTKCGTEGQDSQTFCYRCGMSLQNTGKDKPESTLSSRCAPGSSQGNPSGVSTHDFVSGIKDQLSKELSAIKGDLGREMQSTLADLSSTPFAVKSRGDGIMRESAEHKSDRSVFAVIPPQKCNPPSGRYCIPEQVQRYLAMSKLQQPEEFKDSEPFLSDRSLDNLVEKYLDWAPFLKQGLCADETDEVFLLCEFDTPPARKFKSTFEANTALPNGLIFSVPEQVFLNENPITRNRMFETHSHHRIDCLLVILDESIENIEQFPESWYHEGSQSVRFFNGSRLSPGRLSEKVSTIKEQIEDDWRRATNLGAPPDLLDSYRSIHETLGNLIDIISGFRAFAGFLFVVRWKTRTARQPEPGMVRNIATNRLSIGQFLASGMMDVESTFKPKLEIIRDEFLSFYRIHCGIPYISKVTIRNTSSVTRNDYILKISIPGFLIDDFEMKLDAIPPLGKLTLSDIPLAFDQKRFQTVTEAIKTAVLNIKLYEGNRLVLSDVTRIEILAYNTYRLEDIYIPGHERTLACFVLPNDVSFDETLRIARERLETRIGSSAFAGYQIDKMHINAMIQEIFLVLSRDMRITYIDPPASFRLNVGDFGLIQSQKILLPRDIMRQRMGTCLDLALFLAGLIERIGIDPWLFLVPGHALLGYWLVNRPHHAMIRPEAIYRNRTDVMELIGKGWVRAINSVTFTQSGASFEDALSQGAAFMSGEVHSAIDISAARDHGITPLPFLYE